MSNKDEMSDIYQSRTRPLEEQEKDRKLAEEKLGVKITRPTTTLPSEHSFEDIHPVRKENNDSFLTITSSDSETVYEPIEVDDEQTDKEKPVAINPIVLADKARDVNIVSNGPVESDIPLFDSTPEGKAVEELIRKTELEKQQSVNLNTQVTKSEKELNNKDIGSKKVQEDEIPLFSTENVVSNTSKRNNNLSLNPDIKNNPSIHNRDKVRNEPQTVKGTVGGTENGVEFQKVLKEHVKPVKEVVTDDSLVDINELNTIIEQSNSTKDTKAIEVAKKVKKSRDDKIQKETKKKLQDEKDYGIKSGLKKTSEEVVKNSGIIKEEDIEVEEELYEEETTSDSKVIEVKEKKLILIAEGDAHMIEYFHKNKVYPATAIMDLSKLRELLPYFGEKDDVLIVIRGLTDFTMAEIYACIHDITEIGDKLNSVRILTNVELGVVDLPYYHYEGDLFYGKVEQIIKNKHVELDEDGEPYIGKHKKPKKEKGTVEDTKMKVNPIMAKYKGYNNPSVRFGIYGKQTKELTLDNEEINLLNKIVFVDTVRGTANTGNAHRVYRDLKTYSKQK